MRQRGCHAEDNVARSLKKRLLGSLKAGYGKDAKGKVAYLMYMDRFRDVHIYGQNVGRRVFEKGESGCLEA